ncbi:MAG: hypothetical protein ACRC38_12245, partial [Plesiomonas sp.]
SAFKRRISRRSTVVVSMINMRIILNLPDFILLFCAFSLCNTPVKILNDRQLGIFTGVLTGILTGELSL